MINLYTAFFPTAKNMLENLIDWLTEAKQMEKDKKFGEEVIPGAKIYPDMLNLATQVRITCDTVKLALSRIGDIENTVFEDNEKTLDELIARIKKTLVFFEKVPENAIKGKEEKMVNIKLRDIEFNWKSEFYLENHIIPNFYFHISVAYCILRSMGLELGKRKFLPYSRNN